MRKEIPFNNVSHDYERVLKEFVSQIHDKLGNRLVMVYLTGSYARGDATDYSDIDLFCIFIHIFLYRIFSF
jgi:predicted nucleotidyltransferase